MYLYEGSPSALKRFPGLAIEVPRVPANVAKGAIPDIVCLAFDMRCYTIPSGYIRVTMVGK